MRTIIAVALAAATQLGAQRPDFSGEWTRSDSTARSVATAGDASFRRGDMGTGWGSALTLTQRADSLIVEYVFFNAYDLQPKVRFAYAMSGSESKNTLMIGHADSMQRSRLSWRGDTLVITTQHSIPGDARATADVRQTLRLESPGVLVVETTRGAMLGGVENVVRATYTKK